MGYKPQEINSLLIYSGKETVLDVLLEQNVMTCSVQSPLSAPYMITPFASVQNRSQPSHSIILGSYEFKLSKNTVMSLNTKISWLGNKRYTPIRTTEDQYGFKIDYTKAYGRRAGLFLE